MATSDGIREPRHFMRRAPSARVRAGAYVASCVVALVAFARTADAQVQDLGHRLPGAIGLDAGTQPDQGLYVGDALVWFASDEVHDRSGNVIPIQGLDIDGYANVLGVAGTLKLACVYASAAFSIPVVKLSLSSDNPAASVDRLALGDAFVAPLKLGARLRHVDVIGSYSVYVPTGQGERSGVGRSQWAHQLAAGGTLFFDEHRGARLSALASYLHNEPKQGIDITRGDTVQIQGGAGGRVLGVIDAGIAGYALWQITDDRGKDLPPQLVGAREQAYGLGPEIDVTVRPLRSRITARWLWDLDGRARPVGTILVAGISVLAWR